MTACQLGAVAPVVGLVNADLRLSPGLSGVAISLITLAAAAGATPLGLVIHRWDPSRLVTCGLVVMAGAGIATALTGHQAAALFLALRATAGLGYLLVVVAGPSLLVTQVRQSRRSPWLALWGSCIPAGLALSAAAGGALGPVIGWRGWFAALGGSSVVLAIAVWRVGARAHRPLSAPAPSVDGMAWRRPVQLSVGFGLLASLPVAVASLLPTYLAAGPGLPSAQAGTLTSLVAVAGVPASMVAGLLLRFGVRPAVIASVGVACPLFGALGFAGLSLSVTIGAGIALGFAAGLGVAAAYGALPDVTRRPSDVAIANGLLVQLGSVGTLIAPPVFAASVAPDRWQLMPYLLAVPAAGGIALVTLATRRSRQYRTAQTRTAQPSGSDRPSRQ